MREPQSKWPTCVRIVVVPHHQRMQQHADLARFCRRTPIPLALLTSRAGATPANAGSIHYAQAAIGFSALIVREQLLVR
jgi:hypothetical protein